MTSSTDQPAPLDAARLQEIRHESAAYASVEYLTINARDGEPWRRPPTHPVAKKPLVDLVRTVPDLLAEIDRLREQLAERTREPISNAEFSRFVQEAQEQRARADALQAELAAERARNAPLRARVKEIQDRADREMRPLKAHAVRLQKWADALVRTNCANYEKWTADRADLAARTRELEAATSRVAVLEEAICEVVGDHTHGADDWTGCHATLEQAMLAARADGEAGRE